jgi:hypothetical protein
MINKENIQKLEEFYKQINDSKATLDSEYSNAYEGSNERKQKIMRKIEGKDVEVEAPEDKLWFEVMNLGVNCDAGKVLRVVYPKVFDAVDTHEKAVAELNAYCIKEIGIDPLKLSLLDIIKIVDGILDGRKEIESPYK